MAKARQHDSMMDKAVEYKDKVICKLAKKGIETRAYDFYEEWENDGIWFHFSTDGDSDIAVFVWDARRAPWCYYGADRIKL